MNVVAAKRIYLIKMIEKMEKQPQFCKKLDIKNTSHYKNTGEEQGEMYDALFDAGKGVQYIFRIVV